MTQIMTCDGDLMDVTNPDPEHIHIHTIAHHLALQCRYNGACRRFLSVAEHSFLGAQIAEETYNDSELAVAMLLHDAHEAFLGDIISPLKQVLYDSPWWHAADALDLVIQNKYDVSFDDPRIELIDRHMLAIEWTHLMPDSKRYDSYMCLNMDTVLACHEPAEAKRLFIRKAADLGLV